MPRIAFDMIRVESFPNILLLSHFFGFLSVVLKRDLKRSLSIVAREPDFKMLGLAFFTIPVSAWALAGHISAIVIA